MPTGRVSDIQRMTEAGVDLIFNKAAKQATEKYYTAISTEKKLQRRVGSYTTMGDLSAAELKGEGDPIAFDKISQNYETTITAKTVSKGVAATLEQLEDDLYGTVTKAFGGSLIRVMNSYKEKEIANLYNNAFTATGADGVAQISDTHPLQRSALVNDNLATGPLTPANIKAAKNMFIRIYDQAGDFYGSQATHLLINSEFQFAAMEILESALMSDELSNTINSVNKISPVRIILNPYITVTRGATDTAPWFLLDKTMTDAGAILQTKKGLTLETQWDFVTKDYQGTAIERYGSGIISPGYGLVGSTGL